MEGGEGLREGKTDDDDADEETVEHAPAFGESDAVAVFFVDVGTGDDACVRVGRELVGVGWGG